MTTSVPPAERKSIRARITAAILDQLRQGSTPRGIAMSLAVGGVVGLFPILGSTTILCVAVGALFRLNQPLMQLTNYAVYPLQIPMVYVFVRLGETMLRQPHVSFSIGLLMTEFHQHPMKFLHDFGTTGLIGIAAWGVFAIPALSLLYFLLLGLTNRIGREARA